MAIKLGLVGATGKVGKAIVEVVDLQKDCYQIVSQISRQNNSTSNLQSMFELSDVVIDFSLPDQDLLDALLLSSKPLVIGTTGFSDKQLEMIRNRAKDMPIFLSANMSLGANLLAVIAKTVSRNLDDSYDSSIIDIHHRFKRDKPSGTALMLKQSIADVFKSVNISSIRAGNICGEHTIIFAGDDEIIELKHTALNKTMFAKGALKASTWILGKKPGLYSMSDIIGL